MIVRCSQCGARINRRDERRFFTCPFCASSLVLEGDRSFACLIMEHERNDLWAKAAFHERLVKAGIGKNGGAITVTLAYVPFWVVRRIDGTVNAYPASETAYTGPSSLKVPPGRLTFFDETSHPGAPVVSPTVSLGAVLGAEEEKTLGRIDLTYLPVYSMRAHGAGAGHSCVLVADSSRIYSATVPLRERTIHARPLIFFLIAACFFAAAGLLVDDLYAKAAVMGAGGLIFVLLSRPAIGRAR